MALDIVSWFWRVLSAPLRGLGFGPGRTSLLVVASTLFLGPLCTSPAQPQGARPSASWSRTLRHLGDAVIARPFKTIRSPVDSVLGPATRSSFNSIIDVVLDWLPSLDDNVSASDLMRSFGYPTEVHFVYTEDGFRLRLDRVPNPGRQPVYIAHGLQTAAPSFVLLGKEKCISALLHDAGYDVWMVNFRGTHYSQVHKKYSVQDEELWTFSFHEHGVYDNTAAIDYVLKKTSYPSVFYVGHSMGCTSFMTMASTRPAFQDKVRAAFLMAPAGPLHHNHSQLVKFIYALLDYLQPAVQRLNLHFTMRAVYRVFRRLGKMLVPIYGPLLYAFTNTIVGFRDNPDYYDLQSFWNTIPSGGSWNELFHFIQNANPNEDGFRMYDYGKAKNIERYGSPVPPEYDLAAIRTPIFMYLAHNDVLCDPRDMDYLRSKFQNVVSVHYASNPDFNHIDFFTRKTADSEIYRPLIKHMQVFVDGNDQVADMDNRLSQEK